MQQHDAPSGAAGLRNQVEKPQAVVPRKTQQYIILGVATLIVLIALFSSHGNAKTSATQQASGGSDPAAPSASEISTYEQQLQQLQQAAQGGPKAPGPGTTDTALRERQLAMQGALPAESSDPPAPNPIHQQEQKLAYQSLFASNIALSYRGKEAGDPPPTAASAPPSAQTAIPMQLQQALAANPTPTLKQPTPASSAEPVAPQSPSPQKTAAPDARASASSIVLPEGSILPTVLLNRLNGDFAGPVECMVSSDVYSPDRQHVVIPAGSRVLGEAKPVAGLGQRRLAVMFHRLLLPNGQSFSLDTAPGLDQSGATALHDKVNNHYFQIFGVSAAVGLLGAAAQFGESPDLAAGRALFLQGVGTGMSQASMQVLDKFLNIMPTITIREGHRVNIYLMHDLVLPAYPTGAWETPITGGIQP